MCANNESISESLLGSDDDVDDWLPDIPEDCNKLTCACSKSAANSLLMCKKCRLSPPVKETVIDLTSPVKKNCQQRKRHLDDSYPHSSKSKIPRHFSNIFSPMNTSEPDISIKVESSNSEQIPNNILGSEFTGRLVKAKSKNVITKSQQANFKHTTVMPRAEEECRLLNWQQSVRLPCLLGVPTHASIDNTEKSEKGRKVYTFNNPVLSVIKAFESEYTERTGDDLLQLINGFSNRTQEPPCILLNHLLKTMIESECDRTVFKIHCTLLTLIEKHPPSRSSDLPFDWSFIETVIKNLNLRLGLSDHLDSRSSSPCAALASTLALDFVVTYLESDLVHCALGSQRQVSRSVASNLLYERNIKMVVEWLQLALISYNEFDDLLLERLSINEGNCKIPLAQVEKVLPLLQRLLDLNIATAQYPEDAAFCMARRLLQVYHLCCMQKRQLLLKTLLSPLVKLMLVQLVLDKYRGYNEETSMPSFNSLKNITSLFTKLMPLISDNGMGETPPGSPNQEEDQQYMQVSGSRATFLQNATEELGMLLYTAVDSYILVERENHKEPCSIKYLSYINRRKQWKRLKEEDLDTLRNLHYHVEVLRQHLLTMMEGGLSNRTEDFLDELLCLSDHAVVDSQKLMAQVIVL